MELRKQAILNALDAFVRQRAGLDFGNYGDVKSYRAEQRSITRDLHNYRALRSAVTSESLTADMLLEAARSAFSGRLMISKPCEHQSDRSSKATCGRCGRSWCDDCYPAPSAMCHHCNHYKGAVPDYGAVRIEYCTGQYFPTEYRKAACAVLASALWAWTREHVMPAPSSWRVESWGTWNGNSFDRERSRPMQIHAACKLLEEKGGQQYGHVQEYIAGKTPGDWLRAHFRATFGRGIASGYFN